MFGRAAERQRRVRLEVEAPAVDVDAAAIDGDLAEDLRCASPTRDAKVRRQTELEVGVLAGRPRAWRGAFTRRRKPGHALAGRPGACPVASSASSFFACSLFSGALPVHQHDVGRHVERLQLPALRVGQLDARVVDVDVQARVEGRGAPVHLARSAPRPPAAGPRRVDRKALQLRFGRHVVALPSTWVALPGERAPSRNRSRPTARRAPRASRRREARGGSARIRRTPSPRPSPSFHSSRPGEARIGDGAAHRRRRRQQARRPCAAPASRPTGPGRRSAARPGCTSSGVRRTSRPRVTAG